MRHVTHFRHYATAMGLSLVLLVVGLWVAGMLPDEVWAEAAPASSTTTGEVPCHTLADDGALLPATAPLIGSLPSWPGSNDAFLLCPVCLRAHSPRSRAPPGVSCPPDASDASRYLLGTLAGLRAAGREDISQGEAGPCGTGLSTRRISSVRCVTGRTYTVPGVEVYSIG
jgi:hypothetical protein